VGFCTTLTASRSKKNVRLRTTVLASNRKDFRGVSRTDSYLEAVRRNVRRIHSNSAEDDAEEDSELLMDNALSATCRLSSNYLGFYAGGPYRHLAVCTLRLIPPNKPIHDRRICSPTRPVAPCPINVFYHQFTTIRSNSVRAYTACAKSSNVSVVYITWSNFFSNCLCSVALYFPF